mgnify:CR=1 FL=1
MADRGPVASLYTGMDPLHKELLACGGSRSLFLSVPESRLPAAWLKAVQQDLSANPIEYITHWTWRLDPAFYPHHAGHHAAAQA